MKPDEMVTSTTRGVSLDTECYYQSYNDPNSPDLATFSTQPASCGYNQNGLAYCNQLQGNAMYQNLVQQVKFAFQNNLNCHEHSDVYLNSFDCADLLSKLGKSFYPQYLKLKWLKTENTTI